MSDVLQFGKQPSVGSGSNAQGFSVIELVIALGIVLIMSAVALPSISRTLKTYQLNDAAEQLAGIVKFTRFEAIRRNSAISCVNAENGANAPATIWSDDNGDGAVQPGERQITLSNARTLVPAGSVPGVGSLATAIGAGVLTAVNPAAGNVTFDQRGGTAPPAVYAFYVGNTTTPENGFRAVIVLPSGSVQVWSYPGGAAGAWHQVN